MNDDKALWDELRQCEAARGVGMSPLFTFTMLERNVFDAMSAQECLALKHDEDETLFCRMDIHEHDLRVVRRKAYFTGVEHERWYQEDRRKLAIGAAFFFGFCGGMLVAAILTWGFNG